VGPGFAHGEGEGKNDPRIGMETFAMNKSNPGSPKNLADNSLKINVTDPSQRSGFRVTEQ
jgi:hypothetical protein